MLEYATKALLRSYADEVPLTEQANVRRGAEHRSPAGATFLSHSSRDADLVVGAIRLLGDHGATVYVDKKDQTLPPYTNRETASGLKRRIHQSGKFVLLASDNSKDSRWVPWELGIADERKGMERVCILPSVDSVTNVAWTNWEYIGLYDRIMKEDVPGTSRKRWVVRDVRSNTSVPLSAWLTRA